MHAARKRFEFGFDRVLTRAGRKSRWRWPLGVTYALAGRRDEARKIAVERKKQISPLEMWGLAEIYAALGEKDEAFRWLEAAYNARFSWMPWIETWPNFAPLRNDPRFEKLVRRMNLPQQ